MLSGTLRLLSLVLTGHARNQEELLRTDALMQLGHLLRTVCAAHYSSAFVTALAKVSPNPDPHPNPHPNPHPDPSPNPDPSPHPDPSPNPDPNPSPSPDPSPNPNQVTSYTVCSKVRPARTARAIA